MDLALYDPELGYYARAAQRSGRAGDFFTSVDVGPLFGELLEVQIAEMARHPAKLADTQSLRPRDFRSGRSRRGQRPAVGRHPPRGARARIPRFYDAHAPASGRSQRRGARARSRRRSATCAERLVASSAAAARIVRGRAGRQRAARRAAGASGRDARRRAARDLRRTARRRRGCATDRGSAVDAGARRSISIGSASTLEPGWRVEINLRAVDWIRDAARRLRRGFIILIDYGHEARELYSVTHAGGTLTTFSRHTTAGPERRRTRRRGCERPGRTGPHRARRLHERPRRPPKPRA